ncbi:N,N-dimethylformamidase [Faunimonas pinastri]|uniref:N,N-dimethylformamidase n=1 Tax=Faunimonas pinastri TaxID=1855383 RepID=A0A1H8ZD80_9HYPH|nr:N,N-dimethylformamidase beta subunit family domain-containing protein [Faunimonas pinastri]SEP62362.1 N,N-dimethylformamidase [Faunimonas pinastri]
MRRPVDHSAMPAAGFTAPWSARAGTAIALHLSSINPDPQVRIVRLDSAEPEPLDWPVEKLASAKCESFRQGSFLDLPLRVSAGEFSLTVEFRLTRNPGERVLVDTGELALRLQADGRLALHAIGASIIGASPLPVERWLTLRLTLGAAEATVELVFPKGLAVPPLALPLTEAKRGPIRLGTDLGESTPSANWRIGRITLQAGEQPLEWRFPTRPATDLPPLEGDGPALAIRNAPTFSVTSARWKGDILDPRLGPEQYDAIHLHDDDMDALDWPATHRTALPGSAEPGIYAFEVATSAGTERIPFFVRSPERHATLAFLVPTLTYLAYADENLPSDRFPWACDDRGHRFAQANDLLSLYDMHRDGGGVSLASTRRPKGTLRDDYRYPLSDCPHLLPVDLHLLRFCRAQGIAFDLLTDHDLHEEGVTALDGYAGIFTGSHPEYWTSPMQAGLRAFLDGGGNLAYLGGNGFMWVSAVDGDRMEIRRGRELGARTWDSPPGETSLALTGEPGGMWRERGLSEFALVGTGMTMMGFGPARPYARTEAGRDPAFAWVFEGVEDDLLGGDGIVLGGAAGYEVDRLDGRFGSPADAVVLARADGFDASYEVDPNDWFEDGPIGREAARRADMTVFRHPGGGEVLSVGSVAWCGALPGGGDRNAIGRITANILRRFAGSS